MKNPKRHSRSKFSKSIIFSLVFLVLGFMMAYSYGLSNSKDSSGKFTGGAFFEQEERYRKDLIEQQERNKTLREEIEEKQTAKAKIPAMQKKRKRFAACWGFCPCKAKGWP
jgi:hypothetical protein